MSHKGLTSGKISYARFAGSSSFGKRYLSVAPRDIAKRIIASLGPPCGGLFARTDVDLVGPMLAILFLVAVVHRGFADKDPGSADTASSPIYVILAYALLMPAFGFLLCRLSKASIGFWDLTGLFGYSLYSYVIILGVSFLVYQEESNSFFFLCLFVFGGPSALRICILLLSKIPKPAARLLICSTLVTIHLLFLIFLHFVYMHPTFVYGVGAIKRTMNVEGGSAA